MALVPGYPGTRGQLRPPNPLQFAPFHFKVGACAGSGLNFRDAKPECAPFAFSLCFCRESAALPTAVQIQ
eukprot:1436667-Rhodomonas_salina.1